MEQYNSVLQECLRLPVSRSMESSRYKCQDLTRAQNSHWVTDSQVDSAYILSAQVKGVGGMLRVNGPMGGSLEPCVLGVNRSCDSLRLET